jgi:hypothetical protein
MAVPPTAGYGLLKRPSPGCEGTDETCRVEMWRGGGRSNMSVAAPFVWRCPRTGVLSSIPASFTISRRSNLHKSNQTRKLLRCRTVVGMYCARYCTQESRLHPRGWGAYIFAIPMGTPELNDSLTITRNR